MRLLEFVVPHPRWLYQATVRPTPNRSNSSDASRAAEGRNDLLLNTDGLGKDLQQLNVNNAEACR